MEKLIIRGRNEMMDVFVILCLVMAVMPLVIGFIVLLIAFAEEIGWFPIILILIFLIGICGLGILGEFN